jgi:hypothetical protein
MCTSVPERAAARGCCGPCQISSTSMPDFLRLPHSSAAVIRYCRTDNADTALMAGLPLPAPSTALNQLDGLLMVKLPFRDDLRQYTFRTFNDPSKPHVRLRSPHDPFRWRLVSGSRLRLAGGMQDHLVVCVLSFKHGSDSVGVCSVPCSCIQQWSRPQPCGSS